MQGLQRTISDEQIFRYVWILGADDRLLEVYCGLTPDQIEDAILRVLQGAYATA